LPGSDATPIAVDASAAVTSAQRFDVPADAGAEVVNAADATNTNARTDERKGRGMDRRLHHVEGVSFSGDAARALNASRDGRQAASQSDDPDSAFAELGLDVGVLRPSRFRRRVALARRVPLVSRDEGEIHFWVCEDAELCENSSCYVYVDHAAALYAEYLANGNEHMEAPAATDYDVLEFSIVDPHGNQIRVGSDVPAIT
jgi:hypothetical protein